MVIYYLGPEGTNGHEAAIQCKESLFKNAELSPCSTNGDAVKQFFHSNDEAIACVPIENSIQGAVTQTWDTLTNHLIQERREHATSKDVTSEHKAGKTAGIFAAITLHIHHYVVYRQGTNFAQVKRVYSHPQALAQCQVHLAELFPQASVAAVNSTAEAARMVADENGTASVAVASQRAAQRYGLDYLQQPIEDRVGNVTRFALIGRQQVQPDAQHLSALGDSEADRIVSLCLIGVADQPGGLVGALAPFAEAGLNLARLESRPVGNQLGKYIFYVDVSFPKEAEQRAELSLQAVLQQLTARQTDVIFLGAYPVFHGR